MALLERDLIAAKNAAVNFCSIKTVEFLVAALKALEFLLLLIRKYLDANIRTLRVLIQTVPRIKLLSRSTLSFEPGEMERRFFSIPAPLTKLNLRPAQKKQLSILLADPVRIYTWICNQKSARSRDDVLEHWGVPRDVIEAFNRSGLKNANAIDCLAYWRRTIVCRFEKQGISTKSSFNSLEESPTRVTACVQAPETDDALMGVLTSPVEKLLSKNTGMSATDTIKAYKLRPDRTRYAEKHIISNLPENATLEEKILILNTYAVPKEFYDANNPNLVDALESWLRVLRERIGNITSLEKPQRPTNPPFQQPAIADTLSQII